MRRCLSSAAVAVLARLARLLLGAKFSAYQFVSLHAMDLTCGSLFIDSILGHGGSGGRICMALDA